jgi:hypothetical protein
MALIARIANTKKECFTMVPILLFQSLFGLQKLSVCDFMGYSCQKKDMRREILLKLSVLPFPFLN